MMLLALLTAPLLAAQEPAAAQLSVPQSQDLAAIRALQSQRVEVMAAVAPAVCSVMKMDSPGGGSGVIFDPLGFVLTNYHVVGERKENAYPTMKIGLPDGRLYEGKVLGIDPGSDLAVIYLGEREDGQPWPYAPLGDSDALLVGEPVFAMGNPFLLATDFKPTVTWGIVSGTHRYQGGQGNRMLVYPDCIQVDAPINPGNSGGPLFNELGEVIGINGRIQLRDRGRVNTGVGFAIASNQIRNFLGDMMAGRHTEHGTLDLNAYFMNSRGEQRRGVFVQAVFADSRARELGVDLGDELIRFNGEEIRSANQLATMVGVLPEGAWVTLDYRPLEEGVLGDLRSIVLRLSRLDTGSSAREDWLATDEIRRAARDALSRGWCKGDDPGHAVMTTVRADGTKVVRTRSGDQLRMDMDGRSLIREAPGKGFKLVNGRVLDLSPEELALLEREFACNPALHVGDSLAARLQPTLLYGGVFVHGRAAYAFEIPGDVAQRMYLYEDGVPAGYVFRDPIALEEIEYRLPHPDVVARAQAAHEADASVTVPGLRVQREDGTMETVGSWSLDLSTAPDPTLFARPGS